MILVDLRDVAASRPGRSLFEDLSVTVATGDRLGIVGINGTGKSTLLRVIAGIEEPERGTVTFGRGVRVARLDQHPVLAGATVAEAAGGSWEAAAILDRLGMGSMLDRSVGELSGGQAKRVALAAALVSPGDLLVLDEPTNHLDLDATFWLEEWLAGYGGGLVMVSHDRHVLDRVTNRMIELDRGRAHVHEGGYSSYLDAVGEREERSAAAERVRRNLARRELAWLRRGAPARTSKPKARIATATALIEAGPQAAARQGPLELHTDTPRLGDVVVELHDAGVDLDDGAGGRSLFSHVELLLDPRERLGVVGPNGAGKTTLLDVLSGRRAPDHGRVVRGTTAVVGYYDQLGTELDPSARVRDVVAGPHRPPDHRDAALMSAFWFDEDLQYAPVGLLSGGERRRLQLLVTLAAHPNVLLLDEPTNDLDLDTLRALEDFLDDWPGALVVVSHDRAFLERTVADVVVLDGTGRVARRPGGFAAYEAERRGAARRRGSVAGPVAPSAPSGGTAVGAGEAAAERAARRSSSKGRSPAHLRALWRAAAERVDALEARRAEATALLADPTADHEARDRAARELASVEADLVAAEEEWLTLGAEAEERGLEL